MYVSLPSERLKCLVNILKQAITLPRFGHKSFAKSGMILLPSFPYKCFLLKQDDFCPKEFKKSSKNAQTITLGFRYSRSRTIYLILKAIKKKPSQIRITFFHSIRNLYYNRLVSLNQNTGI